jgi:beta-xylosidase
VNHKAKATIGKLILFAVPLVGLVGLVTNIGLIQNLLPRASGEPARLVINLDGDTGPLDPMWQNLAQGGENKDYRFAPVKDLIKPLKPQYIRLDHLYDFYDIVGRENGQLTFNWEKLDPVISDIRAAGALPYISLSYMPPALSSSGDITGKPDNWGEWQLVVQRTIEHISGRSGLNLPNVYYEVWNEPDLFGGWKTYGDKNYLELYQYSAQGAARAANTNSFKIGGPATTAPYQNWIEGFFTYAAANNLRVDFYSWHRYSYDVQTYIDDINLFKQNIRNYPNYFSVETHITEWGPNSENDPVYDGQLAAAHLIAVTAEIYPSITRAFAFEIQDGKDPGGQEYWGRWGMLTHQDFGSKPKPRYQAMKLLNQLGSQRLALTGQGTWVKAIAARKDRATQVLITNYDPEGRNTETVPVIFDNVEPGSFTLTQTFMGRSAQTIPLATDSARLRYNLPMSPNSVALLELTQNE